MAQISKQQQKRTEVRYILENVTNNPKFCANITNTSLKTVYNVKKLIETNRSVDRRQGSGKNPKLTAIDRQRLGTVVHANPLHSNKQIANRLEELGAEKVSRFTIGRELKKLKIFRFQVCYRPLLTQKHIDARLSFCFKYRNFNWSKVIFSDESMFQLHPNSLKMLGKQRKILQKPKFSPKFMVWGGISSKGKTELKICKKNMNSGIYFDLNGIFTS